MLGNIEIRKRHDVVLIVLVVTGFCVFCSATATWLATAASPPASRNLALALAVFIPAILASVCSTMLALALRNATRLKDELARLAWLDELTGVFNRRAFFAEAERMLSLARRNRDTASLIMLDIDRLKAINDTFGHEFGDRVIDGLARTASKFVRASDVMARIGGDDFVILAYGAGADDAADIAERIRNAIATSPLTDGRGRLSVTTSIGVAQIESAAGLLEAMRRADRALYVAKANGRNRVECEAKKLIVMEPEREADAA